MSDFRQYLEKMCIIRNLDLFDPYSSLLLRESSRFKSANPFVLTEQELTFTLDLLSPKPCTFPVLYSPFDLFDTTTDIIRIQNTPFSSSLLRFEERTTTDQYLQSLCNRISALELRIDRAFNTKVEIPDRKYKWITEIKDPEKNGFDRKYKCTAEIKGGKRSLYEWDLIDSGEKSCKWTAEVKGKGKNEPISHTYTVTTSNKAGTEIKSSTKQQKKSPSSRVVEIEDPCNDRNAVLLKRAFARRTTAVCKGKKKELTPQEAALLIQINYRAHLVRRSQVLRALRDLAVAKAKLKEIRALFSNFSYRHLVASNLEERQRFSEKIIVLLLTVDAIEGADYMVRTARRSMLLELEELLDTIDPQPARRMGSLKRWQFDLPCPGSIPEVITSRVAKVVELVEQEASGSI